MTKVAKRLIKTLAPGLGGLYMQRLAFGESRNDVYAGEVMNLL